jgi:hypothetical protein
MGGKRTFAQRSAADWLAESRLGYLDCFDQAGVHAEVAKAQAHQTFGRRVDHVPAPPNKRHICGINSLLVAHRWAGRETRKVGPSGSPELKIALIEGLTLEAEPENAGKCLYRTELPLIGEH